MQTTGHVTIGGKIVAKYSSNRLPPRPRDFELVFRFTLSNGNVQKIEDLASQTKAIRDKQTALDNERKESYEADKYSSYGSFFASFKKDEYSQLNKDERCIEYPINCES